MTRSKRYTATLSEILTRTLLAPIVWLAAGLTLCPGTTSLANPITPPVTQDNGSAVQAAPYYVITLDTNLDTMTVQLNASRTGTWYALSAELPERTRLLHNATQRRDRLTAIDRKQTARYTVDLQHSANQWLLTRRLSGAPLRIADWEDWLWVPPDWHIGAPLQITFKHDPKVHISLPFTLIERGQGYTRFEVPRQLPTHGGTGLFGDIGIRDLQLPGGLLAITVLAIDPQTRKRLLDWAETVARNVVSVHGRLPGEYTQLVILPVPAGTEPVPTAYVRRGGGNGIITVVSSATDHRILARDWSLYHEFTHLYHPYLGDEGRWIAEGFASYFQNVYRARSNVVSPEEAWQRTLAGFARAQREMQLRPGSSVNEGGRMQTYWTGAAMALAADVELLETTQGCWDLARLLTAYSRCCLPAPQSWPVRGFLRRLDELANVEIFVRRYEQILPLQRFPFPGHVQFGSDGVQNLFGARPAPSQGRTQEILKHAAEESSRVNCPGRL